MTARGLCEESEEPRIWSLWLTPLVLLGIWAILWTLWIIWLEIWSNLICLALYFLIRMQNFSKFSWSKLILRTFKLRKIGLGILIQGGKAIIILLFILLFNSLIPHLINFAFLLFYSLLTDTILTVNSLLQILKNMK